MAAQSVLLVHPDDDMVVALRDLGSGESVSLAAEAWTVSEPVQAKHKFARRDLAEGQLIRMYGLVVGRALCPISCGQVLTTKNVEHATGAVDANAGNGGEGKSRFEWTAPNVSRWSKRRFAGYHRSNGLVGTGNYWIVVPMVFCENRNLQVMADAFLEELGYGRPRHYHAQTRELVRLYQDGAAPSQILETTVTPSVGVADSRRVFPNVDGIKFLTHDGGCGGAYADAVNLCGLLAGYISHPNVAGATVMSLGCQKSQVATLETELHKRNPGDKPIYTFEQQAIGTEIDFVSKAISHTFAGMMIANKSTREPAELKHLCLGVECGASDGFSGLSANPAIGHCSDLLAALGGRVILSEFPELAGCEADLMARCTSPELAQRFLEIMRGYNAHIAASGEGFEANPSPGNIKDGLITDAIKSAGAARKGGTSPVVDVLDFPESATKPGLTLLCTPGGDVESTTAKAGSGANVMLFSTGLGTPTGNPICPVLKVSTNSNVAKRMPDLIDLDAGPVIAGEETIEEVGERMLEMVVATASGEYVAKAQRLGQDDFIPWKRTISF